MRTGTAFVFLAAALGLLRLSFAGEVTQRPAIEKVEIRPNRAIYVNGKPFFPLMSWLQNAGNFPSVVECGMNTTAGYAGRSRDSEGAAQYLDQVAKAGLYGVMPYRPTLKSHPALLSYIHGDEPDLPHEESDADIVPAATMRVNSKTPLWKLVDGDTSSWSAFDPLEGSSVTIKLKEPVTVESLSVWPTLSSGLSVAKEIAFEANGKEILRAKLEAKKGRQKFDLPKPATFRELTMKVLSVEPGSNVWGSFGEVEGFDKAGKNVLLSPPRTVPRAMPDRTLREYQAIKAGDPSRPVFMTVTGYFHPFFKKYGDEPRKMYPEYIKCTDVIGYDIYPIYGWNKPEWIYLVHEATDRLVGMSGGRPVYAWIETSKGSQWTGELERQKDVTPTHIRAEVWMAICRGATAIGYFTHIWKPSYQQFGVPPENRKALAEINAQITRLAPAILGDDPGRAVSIISKENVKLDAMAKRKDGDLYIFAVNYDETLKKAAATIKVEGLKAGMSVVVEDEGRTLKADNGSFEDPFEPLAVHIYRIAVSSK
jgi:hypothetical protein